MAKPEQLLADNPERIADAIRNISRASAALLKSGLNERALILLLHDLSNVPKTHVAYVLRNLPLLEREFCHKKDA